MRSQGGTWHRPEPGRSHRVRALPQGTGREPFDLMIAATALAAERPCYTRNGDDLRALDDLLEVVVV